MLEWVPPDDIDAEVVSLCRAMNAVPGIATDSSCCGHGVHPFWIWFSIRDLEVLPDLLYWFDSCHSGHRGWRCIVTTDCAKSPVRFHVEGPVGAYVEADDIARLITEDLGKARLEG